MGKKKGAIKEYEKKESYNIEDVLSKIQPGKGDKESRIDFDGDLIRMNSGRYLNFFLHGTCCVRCGLKGEYFTKERASGDISYHFNLYGRDTSGREVMLTRDHVIPTSRGGSFSDPVNWQVLCKDCNETKGNQLEEELVEQSVAATG